MNPKQTRVSLLTILLIIAALGIVVFLFDFPPSWAVGIFVVLAIIALMLIRRQAPPGSNRLLIGLAILAIVAGLALNAYLAVQPEIPEDLPAEVLNLPTAYDTVPMGAENFVVFFAPEGDTRLTIQFENISALNGYWAYEDAWVDAEQALRGTYDANPRERAPNWPDTITTSDNTPTQSITPAFTVELPLEDKHLYDEVELSARMIVTYPEPLGDDAYEVNERRASRRFTLFVASPLDRALREQYDAWSRRSGVLSGNGLIALLTVAALGAIFTLWGIGKIRAAGGYGVILPSLLGKLGVVVADTALIPKQAIQGAIPKGVVIVGKIRPSSPAERAGLFPSDIIIEADGKPVDSHRAAKRIVEKWKRGEDHTLVVQRGQQNVQVYVQM